MNEEAKKLANDHWNYISDVLLNHNEQDHIIELLSFHYQTAFIHGFKHGVEWLKNQREKQNNEPTKRSFP